MIVISNHVSKHFPPPADAVIRLNLAWCASREAAEEALGAITQDIYLDFPDGRMKPPVPKLTLEQAVKLADTYQKVKYFAISNAESVKRLREVQGKLRKGVALVPKIETKKGVLTMDLMVLEAGIRTMMLDKEDLYTDLRKDAKVFDLYVDLARAKARALGVELIELQGVVFA